MMIEMELESSLNALTISDHENYTDITGTVTHVEKYKKGNNGIYFSVYTDNGANIQCHCGFFCIVREYDRLNGKALLTQSTFVYEFIAHPLVIVSESKDYILSVFKKASKNYTVTKEMYNFYVFLLKTAGSKIFDHICELAAGDLNKIINRYSDVIHVETTLRILIKWNKEVNMRRLYLLGFTNKEINSISLTPLQIYTRALYNPFQFPQLSITRCKEIVDRIGLTLSDDNMICGLIARDVNGNMLNKSWVYTPKSELRYLYTQYNIEIDNYETLLCEKYDIIISNDRLLIQEQYRITSYVADKMLHLLTLDCDTSTVPQFKHILSDEQKAAVQYALTHSLTVITGFAGTGKTTVIKELAHQISILNLGYYVLSFTGKAVANIRKVCKDVAAQTIHRFIRPGHKQPDYIIIDEISTVNIELMYQLLCKFETLPKMIFIGDNNQLPPIGCGNFLQEMLKYNINVCRLTTVYRVKKVNDEHGNMCDGIYINSMETITDYPVIKPYPNFQIMQGDENTVINIIRALQRKNIDKRDFIIITPYNRFIPLLNNDCQSLYVNNTGVCDSRGRKWYLGDKVMMIVNNYDIDVMNGEEGYVSKTSPDEISVTFNKTEFIFSLLCANSNIVEEYSLPEDYTSDGKLTVDTLVHSYAITIHKSQGSEWNYVVVYIPDDGKTTAFLNKNLFYTAISRAKIAVWCVSSMKSIVQMAHNSRPNCFELLNELMVSRSNN